MNTELLAVGPGRAGRSPGTIIADLTARKAIRSGVLWGYVFGIVVASSALSYVSIYKTQAERHRLEVAFGSNNATSALFGPATRLQTVAGFTVLKASMTLMILGAVWGLLTSTRLLRGEEESGRWELLVAGQTTPRRATGQVIVGLGTGVGALWLLTALITIAAGHSSKVHIAAGPAMFFALALVSSAVMFLAVGALTSQLAATRRQAAAYAAGVLGVSYAVRLVADSGVGLHSLRWASPLGWVEQLQPLTAPRPLALVPIVAFTIAVLVTAVHLAGTRDLGASTVPDRVHATPHFRLLSGPLGLAIRLMRSTVVGWGVATAVSGLLLGLVAKAAGGTFSGSSLKTVFARLGAPGVGADAYLGVAFLMMAILIAFSAVSQVSAARAEESGGRLEHLLVRPLSRLAWFWGRLLVAVVVLVTSGVIAGVTTWLGALSQHADVRFTTTLNAGLNIVPPALCILGIGSLVIGLWPRATAAVTYGVLTWSLLVVIIGGIGALSHWVQDTSIFHHMAAAPAVEPNWGANAIMVAVGAAGAVIGAWGFARRDLQGE